MSTLVGSIYYDVTLDTSSLVSKTRAIQPELERAAGSFNIITRAVQLYAAALTLVKAAEMADDMRLLAARVNVASDSIEAGAAAMDQLRKISTETRSALADNVTVFTRLNPALKQMGGNASDTLRIVDLLSKAITVSGASAAEKSSAMIQFGQALGSGKLAGDELRSLLETAPYLMKQLAAGLGVPIGALKGLGEQGKLTADVVVNALGKAADSINKDFSTFPQTLSSAFTVASDALGRLVELIDRFAQNSTVLTGIVTGVGQALSSLSDALLMAGRSSDDLGRRKEVQEWAKSTAQVLSYVVDAGDFVTRGFAQMGAALGGLAAAGALAAQGEIRQARAALGEMAADVKAIGSRPYLGQQMRDQTRQRSVEDRGFTPQGAPSKLKAPADPEGGRKDASKRAAAQAYLEGLLADTKTGLAKIAAEEEKALQENTRRALQDGKNADIYAKAKTAIVAKYARERALLLEDYEKDAAAARIAVVTDEEQRIEMIRAEAIRSALRDQDLGRKTAAQAAQAISVANFQAEMQLLDRAERQAAARFAGKVASTRNTEELVRLEYEETLRQATANLQRQKITQEEFDAQRLAAARRREDGLRAIERGRLQTRVDTLQLRAGAGGVDDQVALIRAQAEQALAATMDAQAADQANAQAHSDKMVEIEADMHRRIAAMRADANIAAFNSTAAAFGALVEATRRGTGEQDAVYQAAFAAQKAFAIASSIVAIQKGVAEASSLPFPANLAAMATVVASTASIISTIRGTSYGGGRQYGGPVAADSLYRVNESGRPEMFTAANGAQYMLPTRDGRVTSADQVAQQGGSSQRSLSVVQNFTVPAGTDERSQQQIAAAAMRGLLAASQRNN